MTRVSDLFQIQERYLRSAHLERDFTDKGTLATYILTRHAGEAIKRLAVGLQPTSTQRAWRITGDYGCGKSSFALALAHIFGSRDTPLPTHLRDSLDNLQIPIPETQLLPVLVTASHQPLSVSLLRSLHRALVPTTRRAKILDKLKAHIEQPDSFLDAAATIKLLEEASAFVRASGKGAGLLVLVDELGKFLEYAAHNPDRQDAYILQNLAEAAARSGDTPLFVVGLLHQGVTAYADQVSHSVQIEWEKIAGRFDELLFNHPLEQTSYLIAAALNIRPSGLDQGWASLARIQMTAAYDLGWYGAGSSRHGLEEVAAGCLPLHPTVVPVMAHLFRRFGQNERSLFSFLISNEQAALQEFASRSVAPGGFYRLHHLYDYARSSFGHRLGIQSYRSHWNHIDSVVQSFPNEDELSLRILKTIGILNLLDSPSLLPSDEAIVLAVATDDTDEVAIRARIYDLHRSSGLLYFRGRAGGYCLWPHTSVNLDEAYKEAGRACAKEDQILTLVHDYLDSRPLVARRHYIETGNLRHFNVHYVTTDELQAVLGSQCPDADGQVVVVTCQTEEDRRRALELAADPQLLGRPEMLVAVPRPLHNLSKLVHEYQRWQFVADNTPELSRDPYAAEEVSRQVAASRQALENRILHFTGIHQFTASTELEWFCRTESVPISNGRLLLEHLSKICDAVYKDAPNIHNELVNRRALSSAAAAGRQRLIDRILTFGPSPFLGMDPTHKPPEMSMYLSVLQRAGIHREIEHIWKLVEPPQSDDPCHLWPAMQAIRKELCACQENRVGVSHIFEMLRKPPYGVRDGMLPILLAVFSATNEQEVAFYENGNFLVQVTGDDFMRLIKDPRPFEMQYCRLAGLRSEVYERILALLDIPHNKGGPIELLSVIRPLCTFAAQLPQYTRQTSRLSAHASAVRAALLKTQEPPTLLFRDLPEACSTPPFDARDGVDPGHVKTFVLTLKGALDELRAAYPRLLERIRDTLMGAFETDGTCDRLRERLRDQASGIALSISEPELKAFCLRLSDARLAETAWLESVGSLVCARPPMRWADKDEETYCHNVYQLCRRFRRVESLAFMDADAVCRTNSQRLLITRGDGAEIDRVVRFGADDEAEMVRLEEQFLEALRNGRGPGLAAATRAIWTVLSELEATGHE